MMNRLTYGQRPVLSHEMYATTAGFGGFRATIRFAGGGLITSYFRSEGWGEGFVNESYSRAMQFLSRYGIR